MKGLILMPSDGDLAPGHSPSQHGITNPIEKGHGQQAAPLSVSSANVARRISSLAGHLSGALGLRTGPTKAERRLLQLREERQQILELRMANATTYEEWEAAAHLLDELEEHEAWKSSSASDDFYNPKLIRTRLQDLEDARISSDISRMLHLVRTALSRDVGGISSAGLYSHTYTGTKHLVERYVKASVDLIQTLLDRSRKASALPDGLTHREMLDQLLLARRSYGRTALVLSGGSVYGMAHIGVLKALFDRRLLPRIISGTSAGSIVAAVVCTRTDEEIPLVLEKFAQGDLAVFTDKDNPDSWLTHIGRALRYGAWHDSRHIARVMRNLLGDMTFQEAFNRTRRILNITVSSKPGLQLPPLLNYLTAPDVIVWSAVVASCSIPGVFDPRPLLVRDAETGGHVPWDPAEQLWIDGSLDNDVPVERLGEMLNVNQFIVSQTNPHIVLFVTKDERLDIPHEADSGCQSSQENPAGTVPSISDVLYTLGWLGKSEAIYYLETLVDMGVFRESFSMLLQMLNQRYTADINILPRMSLAWGTNLIRNPTPEFMLEACRVGEQATWPSISRIEQACAVELALDRAVHTLRERIAFSDSQVNLRRFFTGSSELGVRNNSFMSSGAGGSGACTVDDNDGDTDPTSVNNMMSPKVANALARHQYRHKRRGSGGSIQLSARRRHNRYTLETILSEDGGHDSDWEYPSGQPIANGPEGSSLAARRGLTDMNLSALLDSNRLGSPKLTRGISHTMAPMAPQIHGEHHRLSLPYRGGVKQNSLQQLPMTPSASKSQVQTPSPNASFFRKGAILDYGGSSNFDNSGLLPFLTVTDDNNDEEEGDEDESPLLQMKSRQRQRRRRSSSASSAVSAISAAAAAAVSKAHQAVLQAVGGMTPAVPQPQHVASEPSIALAPAADSVTAADNSAVPGILNRRQTNDPEETDDEDETGGDSDPYDQAGTSKHVQQQLQQQLPVQQPIPRRRLMQRSRSDPVLSMGIEPLQESKPAEPRTPSPLLRRGDSRTSVEHDHDHTDEEEDGRADHTDVFVSQGE